MTSHLTPGQRALLKSALGQRHQLDRRLADHLGGRSRAEHAREVATQDEDDPPQRESEREMDMALSDFETQEVEAKSARRCAASRPTLTACARTAAPRFRSTA
ncbi:MAG: hypothetical protein U1F49_00200 [Rubrivivax sp.]